MSLTPKSGERGCFAKVSNDPVSTDLASFWLKLRLKNDTKLTCHVQGKSMGALFGPASQVLVKPVEKLPRLGDIVIARLENSLVVHRVIRRSLSAGTVMIKGDNCRRADGYIARDKIIGRVIGVLKDNQITTPRNMRPPFSVGAALISLMQHYLGLTRSRIISIKRYIQS